MDDLVAFHRHHYSRSAVTKRSFIVRIGVIWILLISASLMIDLGPAISRASLVIATVIYLLIVTSLTWLFARKVRDRNVRRLLGEGSNRGILGPHELELNDEIISSKTPLIEIRASWKGVEKIVETEDYAFFYLSAVMSFTVPKRSVTEGDCRQFIDQAKQLVALEKWRES